MSLYQEAKTWNGVWEALEDALTEYGRIPAAPDQIGGSAESYVTSTEQPKLLEALKILRKLEAQCHEQISKNLREQD